MPENIPPSETHASPPPGQYYLMEKIAQGGMAEIFKGLSYDVSGIKRTVCIKKILPHIAASQEFIDALIDEAKIAVTLSHGNIAQTYDLGKVANDYFIVMEYVDGKSLSRIASKAATSGAPVPLPLVCYFIAEVASGLDYIHRRTDEQGHPLHIVHRDISPQNIVVSYAGTVKIIDFGIAVARGRLAITDSGMLKGKFSYMSPEQARGDALDHRSDIFSLGIILYELLTGKRLFKAEDNRQTLRNARRGQVVSPSIIRPDLPDDLDRICMKALARDRRHRFAFASEFRDAIVKFLHTAYPNFQPSDAARYVQELFHDDLLRAAQQEEVHTPHLIIDGTQSALTGDRGPEKTSAALLPVDIRDYLLDEESGDGTKEVAEVPFVTDNDAQEELTPPQPPQKKRMRLTSIGGLFVAVVVMTLVGVWHFLKPVAPSPTSVTQTAELLITTTPADADVLLDGTTIGSGSPVAIRNVTIGEEHELTIQHEGFIPQSRRITLASGEFGSLTFSLTPKEKIRGPIVISSTPSGAIIYIDEQESKFKTPTTLDDLSPGEHTVGVFLDGHRFWERKIKVRPGETQHFDIELAKDLGSLIITSEPSGALVMLDGVPVGQTPLTREGLEPGHIYHIEIWQEGFEHMVRDVRISAGRQEAIRVTLPRE